MEREWEVFQDESYYDMWCVREVHDRNFNSFTSFHFTTKEKAEIFLGLVKEAK